MASYNESIDVHYKCNLKTNIEKRKESRHIKNDRITFSTQNLNQFFLFTYLETLK